MTEVVQRFTYPGANGTGGRDRAEGIRSFLMVENARVISTVQVFQKGRGAGLHAHPTEDGYWLVLGGRARFYGEDEHGEKTIVAELGKHEGIYVPAGIKYGFENPDDEPLEFLRVDYQVAVDGKDPVYFARATWPQGSRADG
jgi:oxalate decarboxylase/phosphoglucose isomerase-like protein (cupin superfamily)